MAETAKQVLAAELKRLFDAAKPDVSLAKLHQRMKRELHETVARSTLSGWMKTDKPVVAVKWRQLEFVVTELLKREKSEQRRLEVREWFRKQWELATAENRMKLAGRPPKVPAGASSRTVGPVTLPPDPQGFAGRDADVAQLLNWLDPTIDQPTVTAAVTGMAGVGKTALAVHLGHIALRRNWYPGGILYLDVYGYSDRDRMRTEDIAAQLLRQLGLPTPSGASEMVPAWRAQARQLAAQNAPLLVVLDNAADSEQVEALLLDAPHRVLITSRRAHSVLAAKQVKVAKLTADEAVDLLDKAVRIADPCDDRITSAPADALRLAEVCGYLPLALTIVVAQLRESPLSTVLDELADVRSRLAKLSYRLSDDKPPLEVRVALELSYTRLGDLEARMFRMLAAIPGVDFSTETASLLMDCDVAATAKLLGELARASLVTCEDSGDRWSAHLLVRLLAVERAERDSSEIWMAWGRLIPHYLDRVADAKRWLQPEDTNGVSVFESEAGALAWLERERMNLVGIAAHTSFSQFPGLASCLSLGLRPFFERRHYVADWLLVSDAAMAELDRLPEDAGIQRLLVIRQHAAALMAARRFDEAVAVLRQQLANAPDLTVMCDLGSALAQAGKEAEALTILRQAASIAEAQGCRHHAAAIANSTGLIHQRAGQHVAAIALFTDAATVFRASQDLRSETPILVNLVTSLMATDQIDTALEAFDRAFKFLYDAGEKHALAVAAGNFGTVLAAKGEPEVALGYCQSAALILRDTEDRHNEALCWRTVLSCLAVVPSDTTIIELAGAMIECFRITHDHLNERETWERVAVAYQRTGDIEMAIVACRALIAGYVDGRWDDARREIWALNELGRMLQQRERTDELLDLFTRAARKASELGDDLLQAYSTANIASALSGTDRLEECAEHLRLALELAGDQDATLTRHVLDNLANVLDELGRR